MAKLTAKQEKFCQNIVKDMNQYEAYIDAYDVKTTTKRETTDNDAYKISSKPEIITRIKFLREPVIAKTRRTLEDILKDIENIKIANLGEDDRIALDCVKHEAKLLGFEVIKTEATIKDISPAKEKVSDKVKKLISK